MNKTMILMAGIFLLMLSAPAFALDYPYASNCTEQSEAQCNLNSCTMICSFSKWLAGDQMPTLDVSGNANVKLTDVWVLEKISHPTEVANKCEWIDKVCTWKNESYDKEGVEICEDQKITGTNGRQCGYTKDDNVYPDWVKKENAKEWSSDYWILSNLVVKYKFNVPFGTQG